jgi:hypothetical protein
MQTTEIADIYLTRFLWPPIMLRAARLLRDLEHFSKLGKGPHGTTSLVYADEWKEAKMMASVS